MRCLFNDATSTIPSVRQQYAYLFPFLDSSLHMGVHVLSLSPGIQVLPIDSSGCRMPCWIKRTILLTRYKRYPLIKK